MGRALLAAVALVACGPATGGSPPPAEPEVPGEHITSHVLERVDGAHYDLLDTRGRPTVILLFTSYGLYSQHVLSMLIRVWERHSTEELEVLAVSAEPESMDVLRTYRDFMEIPFPVLRGDAAVQHGTSPLGRVDVVPLLLFVDESGKVVGRVARVADEEALDAAVTRLLD